MTGTTSRPTFLGVPIEGDITPAEGRTEQWPLERLSPIMQAVLDDAAVGSFGWRQYTPYFNDGDPCVFHAHGFWAEPASSAHIIVDPPDSPWEAGDHRSFEDREDSRWGGYERSWGRGRGAYTGPDKDRYDRLDALSDAIGQGHFDDVLLTTFGDHAEITVTSEGITVEEYSHD